VTIYAQILLFDGFDPLDVVAPFEVLSAGSDFAGGREIDVRLVAADGTGPIRSGTRDMVLHATHQLDPALPGYVVVPGASGPIEGDPDEVETIAVLLSRFAAS
jgi:hypothetical protein